MEQADRRLKQPDALSCGRTPVVPLPPLVLMADDRRREGERSVGIVTPIFPRAAVTAVLVAVLLAAASPGSAATVWLCRPGLANDPCTSDLRATVENAKGRTHVERAMPATRPKVDCFYVYPTVSGQTTPNANLNVDPEETAVAK